MRRHNSTIARAFTLVEILIVVVILGILAAMVVPSFANAVEPSQQAAFATNIRGFAQSVELYRVREGDFPPDGTSGQIPNGLEAYIDVSTWERTTPIGGVWDSESDPADLGYGVGVHFNGTGETRDDVYMTELDAIFDDGDLTSGAFREFGDGRYYYVIQPGD
ncbi:MAG: prepilin-type N-terminal cleavage/methylation domain-containing protein [Planctomycetota bacterium]